MCYHNIIKAIGGVILKRKILLILLIISISLSMLMTAIENSSYDKKYYINAFEKYNIEEVTNRPMGDLSIIADSLINYLKGKGGDEILTPHFNEKEVLHMRDVVMLFDYARIVKYTCGAVAIAILIYLSAKGEKKLIGKTLLFGLFSNHILLLILGIMISTNFNKYFIIFHEIFFSNDLWLLDPNTDLMIQMLPEPFFSGMAVKIGLLFFIYLSILQVVGLYYMKKGKYKWKKDFKS